MQIIVIGASGKIGSAIVAALSPRHDIVGASRHGDNPVDITDAASIAALFARIGRFDAVISAAGGAAYKPFPELTEADFAFSLGYKLLGQINVARLALPHLRDGGSITLTSGLWAREPVPHVAAISTVNSGIEGFAAAAALDLPRGLRINVVSPPLVGTPEFDGDRVRRMSAEDTARAYVEAVEGTATGRVIDTRQFARR